MVKIKNPFAGIKVEYARSHPLTKVAVIALIVLSMAAMITLGWSNHQMKRQIEAMRQEAAFLEAENADLKAKVEGRDSVTGVEDIAQEELGLVDPDTIVINPNP